MELRICDICNAELRPGQVGYIFYDYLYCPACWSAHLENERKELSKRREDWGGPAVMKKNFVYDESRFSPIQCIQCKHFFSEWELFTDWFAHGGKCGTITCPVCGVENCR